MSPFRKRTRAATHRYYIGVPPLRAHTNTRAPQIRIIISRWNGMELWVSSFCYLPITYSFWHRWIVCVSWYAIIAIMHLHRNGRKCRNSLTDFRCIQFIFYHTSLCVRYALTDAHTHGRMVNRTIITRCIFTYEKHLFSHYISTTCIRYGLNGQHENRMEEGQCMVMVIYHWNLPFSCLHCRWAFTLYTLHLSLSLFDSFMNRFRYFTIVCVH